MPFFVGVWYNTAEAGKQVFSKKLKKDLIYSELYVNMSQLKKGISAVPRPKKVAEVWENEVSGRERMNMDYVKMLSEQQLKQEIPQFSIGDTVRVHVLIKEGSRERIQVFEGIVIARKNGGISETFTVRRVTYGVGVERTFLLHSPKVTKIEVTRKGKVRRSKLYYLRDRVGKAAKTKQSFK